MCAKSENPGYDVGLHQSQGRELALGTAHTTSSPSLVYAPYICLPKAVVKTTIRPRFDRRSTTIQLQFDRATTIRRPTSRPGCCTAA